MQARESLYGMELITLDMNQLKKICVNPITWTTDASLSKSDHLGALPASKQDDYGYLRLRYLS